MSVREVKNGLDTPVVLIVGVFERAWRLAASFR